MRTVKTKRITLPVGTKKRLYKYGPGAEERLEEEAKLLTRSIEGGADETFHEFAKRVWYPNLEFVSPLTRRRYISAYRTHIRPRIGDVVLKQVRQPVVQEFIHGAMREGVLDPPRYCILRRQRPPKERIVPQILIEFSLFLLLWKLIFENEIYPPTLYT